MARYDLGTTTLGELLNDPQVVEIIERNAPGITSNPMIGMAKGMTAKQVLDMGASMVGKEKIDAIVTEVDQLD